MLSTQDIAQLIQSPRKLGGSEIDQLRQLADRFPYSQVFAILYLQSLALAQDVLLENEIQRLAIRIQDRTVLYNLINTRASETPVAEIPSEVESETTEEKEIEIITSTPEVENIPAIEVVPETKEEEIPAEVIAPEVTPEEIITVEEPTQIEEEILAPAEPTIEIQQPEIIIEEQEVEQNKEETVESKEIIELPTEEPSILETELPVEETVEINLPKEEIKVEESTEEESSDFEREELERKLQLERAYALQEQQNAERQRLINQLTIKPRVEPTPEPEIKTEEPVEIKEKVKETPTVETVSEETTAPKSFTSWLKAASTPQVSIPEEKPVEKPIEQPREEIDLIPTAVYSLEQEEQKIKENSSEEGNKKKNVDALIEKFIKEDPRTTSPKKIVGKPAPERTEMYNPMKKGKESLNDAQLPVSETLAKIFVVQGNFPKAIFAYQQLMLIFPEKKTFFAKQIKELEKKLNTK